MWVKSELDVLAQESAAREAEAFKYRLFQGIDQLKKVYTDIVKYEQKYKPEEAVNLLQEQINTFLSETNQALTRINQEAKAHADEAIATYKKEMGLATTKSEAPSDVAEHEG